ncbi:MAG: zf-HC2 domain-containing protein [Clostridiales bacterium]|nr:zf-HC2 domain-containing protein [Clostridiales bacterium]
MTCLEAQSHITAFINDQLDMATLEQFLDHVNHCSDCREELEVYYTLLTAMRLLDEDKELANQFSQELENKLKNSADKIRKTKNARVRKRFYFLFVTIGFIIFSSISVTKKVLTIPEPEKPAYRLEYIGIPKQYDPVALFIAKYDEKARIYVEGRRKLRFTIYQMVNEEFTSKVFEEYIDAPVMDGLLKMR